MDSVLFVRLIVVFFFQVIVYKSLATNVFANLALEDWLVVQRVKGIGQSVCSLRLK